MIDNWLMAWSRHLFAATSIDLSDFISSMFTFIWLSDPITHSQDLTQPGPNFLINNERGTLENSIWLEDNFIIITTRFMSFHPNEEFSILIAPLRIEILSICHHCYRNSTVQLLWIFSIWKVPSSEEFATLLQIFFDAILCGASYLILKDFPEWLRDKVGCLSEFDFNNPETFEAESTQ